MAKILTGTSEQRNAKPEWLCVVFKVYIPLLSSEDAFVPCDH